MILATVLGESERGIRVFLATNLKEVSCILKIKWTVLGLKDR